MFGLLLDGDRFSVLIEFNDSVLLRIPYIVTEYRGTARSCRSASKHFRKTLAVEYVIAEYECNRIVADEFLADDERIRKSSRALLNRI